MHIYKTNPANHHQLPSAGQERFRSISRLYYRGANACILCYSITDAQSFAEMGIWLTELRRNLPSDVVLHVVGTKADIVARDPSKREVPFERCIAYVAENLAPGMGSTPPPTATPLGMPTYSGGGLYHHHHHHNHHLTAGAAAAGGTGSGTGSANLTSQPQSTEPRSPSSKRSSGFWGQEVGWDACHEISAESGEGVEEVFRVVTRKLVEQNRKMQAALLAATATPGGPETPWGNGSAPPSGGPEMNGAGGYFDGVNPRASFRVGKDRRSWIFSPNFSTPDFTPGGGGGGMMGGGGGAGRAGGEGDYANGGGRSGRGRCC